MEKTNFDKYNNGKLTVNKLNSLIKRNVKVLDKYLDYAELKNLKYDDLIEILNNCEYMENVIRTALSHYDGPVLFQLDKENKTDGYKSFIVESEDKLLKSMEEIRLEAVETLQTTMNYSNGIFEFYTPLTFKRGFKKSTFAINYVISNWLEDTIKSWVKRNNFVIENRIKGPYIIVMKRVVDEYISGKNFDADNFENQRIINKISNAFMINDDVKLMSLYSTFEINPHKKSGMYFYIFSVKDMEKHLDLFNNNFNLK